MLSIITVTLNAGEDLLKTQASLHEQTHPCYEWILVDGNSTDGSIEQSQTHALQPDGFIQGDDLGIYDAMNKGLGHAKGEWVWFIHAGDVLTHKKALSELAVQLSNKFDFTFFDHVRRDSNGNKCIIPQTYPFHHKLFKNLTHQSFLFRRAIKPDFRFNLAYPVSADAEALLKWALHSKPEDWNKAKGTPILYAGGGFSEQYAAQALRERKVWFSLHLKSPWVWGLNQLNLLRQRFKLGAKNAFTAETSPHEMTL
jgi:glycosyltransferase involved in cell wall biosynthesis